MSNLIGPDYYLPCPRCGTPMGNAAGLGLCGRCQMAPDLLVLGDVVPFLEGFQPLEVPFIRAPMMKPYRIKTRYDARTNTLLLIRESLENGRHDEDAKEFYPADHAEVQVEFIEKLEKDLKDYFHNLKVCCTRFDEGDMGIKPIILPKWNQ